jgi:hypothetical protein
VCLKLGHFLQALSVAPRVATLWYLYCETATQCLSLEECREIFQEAFRLKQRCVCHDPSISRYKDAPVLCVADEKRFGWKRGLLFGKIACRNRQAPSPLSVGHAA